MAIQEFNLPDPGEGLTEAEIVTWRVAVGDTVAVNDIVVEVETAKSLVELPVPYAGIVTALLVDEGATVEVGAPIIAVDDGLATESAPEPPEPSAAATPAPAPTPTAGASADPEVGVGLIGGTTSTGRTAVLVGYGVKQTEAKRRPRLKPVLKETIAAPPGDHVTVQSAARTGELVAAHATAVPRDTRPEPHVAAPSTHLHERVHVLAKPPVRKLAKELGVDLATVAPTGPGGTITRDDVLAASPDAGTGGAPSAGAGTAYRPSVAPAEREVRVPIKGVRKHTAAAMVASAFTAPHVTEWVEVDVTATMDLVARLKRDREFREVKVTPLLILAKAICLAVRRNPGINATWDEAAQEIVLKGYVNLGIAAATPRGLVVPNVKDADRLSLRELAEAISALTETAREGRTPPADMAGGTLTITNVGVFGVDCGTPILNPGESAILAFGAVNRRPWVVGEGTTERIEPRWVTTLALSFDHRLVDGELGSRFLADVAAILADPARGLVWG
jgi:2-oxoisovalerate dehydrogenase E2 component (dihydrolipoyl transacylase)